MIAPEFTRNRFDFHAGCHLGALQCGGGDLSPREEALSDADAPDLERFEPFRLKTTTDDEFGGTSADVDDQTWCRRWRQGVSDAEIDKTSLFMPADDVDGKAERALGPAQEFARIVRHAECIGSHRSHRRRVQSRKTFTKPRQALERRLHSDRRDPAIGVEARPDTQGFSPGVLPIDLISLDTADFQPEAVRSQVDDGEGGQRHERHTVAAEARRLAENWHVSATLGA